MTRMKRLERAQSRLGAYSLLRPLSESDVARDFLAHVDDDDGNTKYCVVRTAAAPLNAAEGFSEALEEAAGEASRLDHPNLIKVLDVGQHDGEHFVATEYVPAIAITKIQDALRAENKQLPAPCVIAVGLAVSSALHRLYAGTDTAGGPILHGDVSSERVFIASTGEIKLGDCVIERASRALGPSLQLDRERTRSARGIASLPVEQLLNDRVDPRADQYALGSLMFELLAGAPPFERADVASTVAAVIGAPRPDLRSLAHVPEDLGSVVDRMLARRAEERYPSPSAVFTDLELMSARFDMTSALGLLSGLSRGLQPSSDTPPPSDVIHLTEAMVEPLASDSFPIVDAADEADASTPSGDAFSAGDALSPVAPQLDSTDFAVPGSSGISAPLSSESPMPVSSSGDAFQVPISTMPTSSSDAPQDGTEESGGIATMIWIAVVTAAAVASLFMWAWILNR